MRGESLNQVKIIIFIRVILTNTALFEIPLPSPNDEGDDQTGLRVLFPLAGRRSGSMLPVKAALLVYFRTAKTHFDARY